MLYYNSIFIYIYICIILIYMEICWLGRWGRARNLSSFWTVICRCLASAVIFCWWAQEFVTLQFSTGIYSEFESCCKKNIWNLWTRIFLEMSRAHGHFHAPFSHSAVPWMPSTWLCVSRWPTHFHWPAALISMHFIWILVVSLKSWIHLGFDWACYFAWFGFREWGGGADLLQSFCAATGRSCTLSKTWPRVFEQTVA